MKRDAGCMYILTGDIAGFIFFYILFWVLVLYKTG